MKRFPHLENIQIAKPCPASWEEMKGDDASRYCKICAKNVYALEEMTAEEAEKVVSQKSVCMRIRQDSLGSIFTKSGAVLLAAGALTLAGCKGEEEQVVGTIPTPVEQQIPDSQSKIGRISPQKSSPEPTDSTTESPESVMLTGEVAYKPKPEYTMGDVAAPAPKKSKK